MNTDERRRWAHATRMRREGYEDGYAGRPARYVDADYQASWRRGRAAKQKE